jgi:hypothetical protein
LGIECLLPCKALTGVGTHPRHNGHQRALGHIVAVVDDLSGAECGEEGVLFELVAVLGLVNLHHHTF